MLCSIKMVNFVLQSDRDDCKRGRLDEDIKKSKESRDKKGRESEESKTRERKVKDSDDERKALYERLMEKKSVETSSNERRFQNASSANYIFYN